MSEKTGTHRNLLMSKVIKWLPPSFTVSELLDLQYQEALFSLAPDEIGGWSQIHWQAPSKNIYQWQLLIQSQKWSAHVGLALLLPIRWQWNERQDVAEVSEAYRPKLRLSILPE